MNPKIITLSKKKSDQKSYVQIYYMTPFTYISRKCKLINSERKIKGTLSMEEEVGVDKDKRLA